MSLTWFVFSSFSLNPQKPFAAFGGDLCRLPTHCHLLLLLLSLLLLPLMPPRFCEAVNCPIPPLQVCRPQIPQIQPLFLLYESVNQSCPVPGLPRLWPSRLSWTSSISAACFGERAQYSWIAPGLHSGVSGSWLPSGFQPQYSTSLILGKMFIWKPTNNFSTLQIRGVERKGSLCCHSPVPRVVGSEIRGASSS